MRWAERGVWERLASRTRWTRPINRHADDRLPNSAEEQFLDDYAGHFLAHRRAISILAVVYWTAFTVWDIAQALQNDQFQNVLTYVLALRCLGIVCLAGCAWVSFQKSFVNERYATRVVIVMVGAAYLLLGLMLLMVPFPINYMYYSPGLFMVMIFAYGMFRLRARPAIRLTFALILFSEFVYAFMANDAVAQTHRLFSFYYFPFSSLYLTSFAVIGCAIVVELERTARDAYSRERQLAVSNQSIKTTNTELERLNGALEDSKRDMEAKTAATGRGLSVSWYPSKVVALTLDPWSSGECRLKLGICSLPTNVRERTRRVSVLFQGWLHATARWSARYESRSP